MSISIATKQILIFLQSTKPEVIAIKGKWGTGKTYLWKSLFIKSAKAKSIPLTQYAYVSIFGVKSAEELRDKISESLTAVSSAANDTNPVTYMSNLVDRVVRKSTSIMSSAFDQFMARYNIKLNTHPALKKLLYSSVENTIIVIDDFERKNPALRPDEILGIISELKEQRSCKLVLIMNDEEINNQDREMYEKLREKIIDKEIKFSPSPEECADIALGKPASTIDAKIRELSIKLKIRNIRIIYKIKMLADDMLESIKTLPDEIKFTALHSLVLYTYCYYAPQPHLPNMELLKTLRLGYEYDDDGKENVNKGSWMSTLQDYEYRHTDDFDIVILTGVMQGYFSVTDLSNLANKMDEDLIKTRGIESFEKAWDIYHDSLKDNPDEVANAIYSAFKANINYLSINHLNSAIILLRQLSEGTKADELLESYITLNASNPESLNPDHLTIFPGADQDNALMIRLRKIQGDAKKQATLDEIFKSMEKRDSWSHEDERILKATSEDDMYKLLIKSHGNDMRAIIKFGKMLIPDITLSALTRISGESLINKLRLARHLKS